MNRLLTLSVVAVIRTTIFTFASIVVSQGSFSVTAETTGRLSTSLAVPPFTFAATATFVTVSPISIMITIWS